MRGGTVPTLHYRKECKVFAVTYHAFFFFFFPATYTDGYKWATLPLHAARSPAESTHGSVLGSRCTLITSPFFRRPNVCRRRSLITCRRHTASSTAKQSRWPCYQVLPRGLTNEFYTAIGQNISTQVKRTSRLIITPIEGIGSFKYVGVMSDQHARWESHIPGACKKAAHGCYSLLRGQQNFPRELLKSLYYAFCHGHISCCSESWSAT